MSGAVVRFMESRGPAEGTIVGRCRVMRRLDSGSYGVVYLAQRADDPKGPLVALKLAKQPGDPRFEREGQLLQQMSHQGVPRYEDSGEWTSPRGERHPYVVMEHVEGFTLYEWFREKPRSTREVLRVLAQVARGLEAVHAKGVVHRDVKGDNPTPAAIPTERGAPRLSSDSSSSRESDSTRDCSTEWERRTVRFVVPAWLSSAMAAVVSGLIVAFAAELRRPHPVEPEPWIASPEELPVPPIETPDAGVGEEALASAQDFPRVATPLHALGRVMPKQPYPGQRRPPCDERMQRAINGGCWAGPIGKEKPPCGANAFDFDDGCYMPVFDAPQPPTSEEP